MMNRFVFVLLVCSLSYPTLAQEFSPGFIITLTKDTTRGFILDKIDAELSLGITFKTTKEGADETKYQPSELLGFGFDYRRIFKRFPRNPRQAKGDSVFVFAKKNLQGKINLYTYRKIREDRPDIFLENNQSQLVVHLITPRSVRFTNESGQIKTGESLQYLALISLAKGEPVDNSANARKPGYNENTIQKNIARYNDLYKGDFPASEYHPKIDHFYDIAFGISINGPSDVGFRTAFYRHKFFSEVSRKVSVIRGVSFRYYSNNTVNSRPKDGIEDKDQFLSIVPIGLAFQSASGFIRPYAYLGVSLVLNSNSHSNYVDFVEMKNSHFYVYPAVNVGAGLKIKVASNFIITELTPTLGGYGMFVNLGYSF